MPASDKARVCVHIKNAYKDLSSLARARVNVLSPISGITCERRGQDQRPLSERRGTKVKGGRRKKQVHSKEAGN
jgi:hypothetical protein